ncbi:MAG: orotidine 5'-phosphate decarboxylase / HUMPS family protein [Thermodesulfobacteriota bacterium]
MRAYGIILAADVPSAYAVVSMAARVGTIVDGFKIGVATLLEAGIGILGRVRDLIEDRPLLVDLKVADIGFRAGKTWDGTNAKIIGSLAGSGATHVTVHGFPGPVSVAEAKAAGDDAGLGVLLLPLMSHAGASLFFGSPVDRGRVLEETLRSGLAPVFPDQTPCADVTGAILMLGEALGVEGYIGPATRPDDLRRYRSATRKPIWCPGFGRQDRLGRDLEAQFRDWAAIVGPASAAIVGSAIFKAPDPEAAATEIVEMRDNAVSW